MKYENISSFLIILNLYSPLVQYGMLVNPNFLPTFWYIPWKTLYMHSKANLPFSMVAEIPGLYFSFKYKKKIIKHPIYLITVYLAVCCGCILATIAWSFFSFATRSLFDSCKVSMVFLKSLFSFTRISTFLSNWSMYSFFFLRLSWADIWK